MIECIFTIDYEIYGNGEGSLRELVYEPAKQLKNIFDELGVKFVVFVEAAELEKIDSLGTDPAINEVRQQIREFNEQGFEIALHLHPQWYNARYQCKKWELDYSEYNLCILPDQRIAEIIGDSIAYLQNVLDSPDFMPLAFRAGNWLLQPTTAVAVELAKRGIEIDSSVFKGARRHKMDYRKTADNGYYWRFGDDVTVPDPIGKLVEMPIYTIMVPFWKMVTIKRLGIEHRRVFNRHNFKDRLRRLLDMFQFRQPLKFDFCRMTLDELINVAETALKNDQFSPDIFKPLVAIGHTKDLVDFKTVKLFLSYLVEKKIQISTFKEISGRGSIASQRVVTGSQH